MRSLSMAAVIAATLFPAVMLAYPTVRLKVPPPGRYGIEDLWKATVTSDTVCDAWFEGFVFEASRGQVFWAKTKPFPLPKGTRLYQYRDVKIDKTETVSGYEVFVTRSGQLPAGTYRFVLILRPFGVGDSNEFDAEPMGPPRLITPRDGDTVRQKYPTFTWTPPAPMPAGGVTYELRLVEIRTGQSAQEALAANPPWFEQKDIRSTSLTYPTSARQLEDLQPGKMYAWQVTAKARDGAESRSEVHRLSMGVDVLPSDTSYCGPIVELDSTNADSLIVLGRSVVVMGRDDWLWASAEPVINPALEPRGMLRGSPDTCVRSEPAGIWLDPPVNSAFWLGAGARAFLELHCRGKSGWLRIESQWFNEATGEWLPEKPTASTQEPWIVGDGWLGFVVKMGNSSRRCRGRLVEQTEPGVFKGTYTGWVYYYYAKSVWGVESFEAARKPWEPWPVITLVVGPASLPQGMHRVSTPAAFKTEGDGYIQECKWLVDNPYDGRMRVSVQMTGRPTDLNSKGSLRWVVFCSRLPPVSSPHREDTDPYLPGGTK